jgi:hypothetical protein
MLNTPQIGMIRVVANASSNLLYSRFDSLGSATNAYMETRVQVDSAFQLLNPEISFGFDDRTKFIGVGLDSDEAGFLDPLLAFLPGASVTVPTTTFHVYQVRKYAADSVVLYIDGARRLAIAYGVLPPPLSGSASFGVYFGPLGTGPSRVSVGGNSSSWDYFHYEIGATQP